MMNDIEPCANESELVRDVLDLARSQQDLIEKLIADLDEANAVLKEPEAVKPTWGRGKPFCGACGLQIRGGKFCSECGKPIAWEGR